jgi:hypothetical protein
MLTTDELLDEVFDGKRTALYREFGDWVRGSRRFKAFVTANQSKIRAKLRNVRGSEGMQDLRAELETAALLLTEESFTLEYEKFAAMKRRGPDFTVTFKTHTLFNVEVRRLRAPALENGNSQAPEIKLVAVLCDKAGQMEPNMVNVLWLIPQQDVSEAELSNAAALLRGMAEHKVEEFFTRRGYDSASDFLKQYRRLSAVLIRQPDRNVLWPNPVAAHKVPPEIAAALLRASAGKG